MRFEQKTMKSRIMIVVCMEVLILMQISTTLTTLHTTYVYSNKSSSFQYLLTITFASYEQDTQQFDKRHTE